LASCDKLCAHGVEVDGAELHQAIAIAQQRCDLKTEGQPVHSVSRWQQPLGGRLPLRRLWLAAAEGVASSATTHQAGVTFFKG
jgi:hypothetical protein